jgi:hypothetical protein
MFPLHELEEQIYNKQWVAALASGVGLLSAKQDRALAVQLQGATLAEIGEVVLGGRERARRVVWDAAHILIDHANKKMRCRVDDRESRESARGEISLRQEKFAKLLAELEAEGVTIAKHRERVQLDKAQKELANIFAPLYARQREMEEAQREATYNAQLAGLYPILGAAIIIQALMLLGYAEQLDQVPPEQTAKTYIWLEATGLLEHLPRYQRESGKARWHYDSLYGLFHLDHHS